MRYEAILDLPVKGDKSGNSERKHLRVSARKGNPRAIARLRNPRPYPTSLRYLHQWCEQLVGKSGVSESGLAPLSEPTLQAWSQRTGHRPMELEVQALFALDALLRSPREELERQEREFAQQGSVT